MRKTPENKPKPPTHPPHDGEDGDGGGGKDCRLVMAAGRILQRRRRRRWRRQRMRRNEGSGAPAWRGVQRCRGGSASYSPKWDSSEDDEAPSPRRETPEESWTVIGG